MVISLDTSADIAANIASLIAFFIPLFSDFQIFGFHGISGILKLIVGKVGLQTSNL